MSIDNTNANAMKFLHYLCLILEYVQIFENALERGLSLGDVPLLQRHKVHECAHGLVRIISPQICERTVELVEKERFVREFRRVFFNVNDEVSAPQFGLVFCHLDPAAVHPLEFELKVSQTLDGKIDEEATRDSLRVRGFVGGRRIIERGRFVGDIVSSPCVVGLCAVE